MLRDCAITYREHQARYSLDGRHLAVQKQTNLQKDLMRTRNDALAPGLHRAIDQMAVQAIASWVQSARRRLFRSVITSKSLRVE